MSSLGVGDQALDADEAAAHDGGGSHEDGDDGVADDELVEGEHEDRFVAPVSRFVQRGPEVRLPDVKDPVVAEGKPHAVEDVERDVGHPRHCEEVDVVVEVAQVLLVPLHLLPQEEKELDDAEAASHHQVDGQLGFHRAFVEVIDTC